MIALGLAIYYSALQDQVNLEFKPQLGKKYRYATTVDDGSGKVVVGPEAGLETLFKAVGFKDGGYTVHLFNNFNGQEIQVSTDRVSPKYDSEQLWVDEATKSGSAGAALITKMFGVFGIRQPSSLVLGKESTYEFTPKELESFSSFIPKDVKKSSSCVLAQKLLSVDSLVASIESKFSYKLHAEGEDNGKHVILDMDIDASQSAEFFISNGIPRKVDRKVKMTMNAGAQKTVQELTTHQSLIN